MELISKRAAFLLLFAAVLAVVIGAGYSSSAGESIPCPTGPCFSLSSPLLFYQDFSVPPETDLNDPLVQKSLLEKVKANYVRKWDTGLLKQKDAEYPDLPPTRKTLTFEQHVKSMSGAYPVENGFVSLIVRDAETGDDILADNYVYGVVPQDPKIRKEDAFKKILLPGDAVLSSANLVYHPSVEISQFKAQGSSPVEADHGSGTGEDFPSKPVVSPFQLKRSYELAYKLVLMPKAEEPLPPVCPYACCADTECSSPDFCILNTCKEKGREGEACDPDKVTHDCNYSEGYLCNSVLSQCKEPVEGLVCSRTEDCHVGDRCRMSRFDCILGQCKSVSCSGFASGDGLHATYYNNIDFTGATVEKIEEVNFPYGTWDTGSPVPGIDPDTFSVAWTGQIEAPVSEEFTFYVATDDGVRLWVNDRLLIDQWYPKLAYEEGSGRIALEAGKLYNIKMEYYEDGGFAAASMLWSSKSVPKAVVPRKYLYSTGYTGAPPSATAGEPGTTVYVDAETGRILDIVDNRMAADFQTAGMYYYVVDPVNDCDIFRKRPVTPDGECAPDYGYDITAVGSVQPLWSGNPLLGNFFLFVYSMPLKVFDALPSDMYSASFPYSSIISQKTELAELSSYHTLRYALHYVAEAWWPWDISVYPPTGQSGRVYVEILNDYEKTKGICDGYAGCAIAADSPSDPNKIYLFTDAGLDQTVVAHETFHLVLHPFLGGFRLTSAEGRVLDEGLASYFALWMNRVDGGVGDFRRTMYENTYLGKKIYKNPFYSPVGALPDSELKYSALTSTKIEEHVFGSRHVAAPLIKFNNFIIDPRKPTIYTPADDRRFNYHFNQAVLRAAASMRTANLVNVPRFSYIHHFYKMLDYELERMTRMRFGSKPWFPPEYLEVYRKMVQDMDIDIVVGDLSYVRSPDMLTFRRCTEEGPVYDFRAPPFSVLRNKVKELAVSFDTKDMLGLQTEHFVNGRDFIHMPMSVVADFSKEITIKFPEKAVAVTLILTDEKANAKVFEMKKPDSADVDYKYFEPVKC